MSSIFPSRTSIDVEPSKASHVPFLKSTKSNKSAPSIIKKIARAGSARNSIDLQRASSEQTFPHYSADSGFSDGLEDSVGGKRRSLKLNRSGSSISAFTSHSSQPSSQSQPSEIEIPSQSATRLNGLGRGSSHHARTTSSTSGISSWSSATGNSGGITPVGGTFRHPWAQTPTIKRENSWSANGLGIGGGGMVGLDRGHASSYSQPSIPGFGLPGGYSDEELRDRESDREYEIRGRHSLQLGGGYGLNLDGVDEDEYARYERPTFVRSNTSLSQRNGNAVLHGGSNGVSGRAYTTGDASSSYTPISALPPPLTGSSRGVERGVGLRVNTGVSGVGVAGTSGRGGTPINGSLYGGNSGQVTPINGSSSRIHLGGSSGSWVSGADASSAAIAPSNFYTSTASSSRQNLNLHNSNLQISTNQNSISTQNSTLYQTTAGSDRNLKPLQGFNNSPGQLAMGSSGVATPQLSTSQQDSTTSPASTTTAAPPRPSSTLPRKSTSGPRSRPSLDMRTRGLSEPIKTFIGGVAKKKDLPTNMDEARYRFNTKEQAEAEKFEKEMAKKENRRGRASTTSIGSFHIGSILGGGGGLVGGRGRSGTGATVGTQETYTTAMGSMTTGSRRHTRGNSGATQAGGDEVGGQNGYAYDIDDPSNTEAPAFLDTGEEYAPTEADLAAVNPGPSSRSGTRVTQRTNGSRQKSPKSEKFKEKLHGAKSDTKSQWAAFMLFLKTKLLKMQRNAKKLAAKATGGEKKSA